MKLLRADDHPIAWTPLFFGNAMPGYALFDIAALWSTVALLLPEWCARTQFVFATIVNY